MCCLSALQGTLVNISYQKINTENVIMLNAKDIKGNEICYTEADISITAAIFQD